ncbi:LANO_0C09406g1_1 [Lachancea nothofagi CBS 11611]|uniref:LANO_0C09406g1_1 n=1 Tax=Lachancea nothofagi CBS 11611 TaxID=1266666 RepID=A0A1G4JA19_9SACH|nr:LANO_0C09406g1_1 [Lachancea nothofagi CBS 11611]
MGGHFTDDNVSNEPAMGNKADQFHKILEKIESLESHVTAMVKDFNNRSRPHQEVSKKRKSERAKTARSSKRKIAALSLQRVSSLDLLANVVLQNSDSGKGGSPLSANPSSTSTTGSSGSSDHSEIPGPGTLGDFGVFSSYAILSPKGLEWIKSKSSNCEEETKYLSEWYAQFLQKSRPENLFPVPLGLKPLPNNEILEALLEISQRSGLESLSFVPFKDVSNIYDSYLKGGLRSLKRSHCITLNVAFALVSHFQQHYYKTPIEGMSRLVSDLVQNDEKLREMENIFISNALYHYHQVSILPEGIDTLQAFLCLMSYTDFTGALHASFMMVTLATRLAHDLGLHAEISYEGLTLEESNRRKKIWILCRYFDLKVALILGKPPIVANYDTTASFGFKSTPLEFLAGATLAASADSSYCGLSFAKNLYTLVLKDVGFDKFGGFHTCRLIHIASRVYGQLYAPLTNRNLTKQLRNAQDLLKEMEIFRLSLPEGMRPMDSLNNPSLTELVKNSDLPSAMTRLFIYSIHFSYYMNLIFIQKALFKTQAYMTNIGQSDVIPFYESVKTARTVLSVAIELYELNLASYYRSFQWVINLAFFELFVYTLSKQEISVEFEQDIRLMARLHCDFKRPFETSTGLDIKASTVLRPNLLNNFKYMINVLRKTFLSRFSREVELTEKEKKALEYEHAAAQIPDIPIKTDLNPFIMDGMDFFNVDSNVFSF